MKDKAWTRQAIALNAPAYRITLTDSAGQARPWNLGKNQEANGAEKFFTPAEIREMIPMLSAKNAQGRNVYITPIDPDNHYIVLDDSTAPQITELQNVGYRAALIQESSPGNIQAIFKLPKKSSSNEQQAANALVQRLNKKFGDPNFSGVIHPFRMAGFTNRKEKHKDTKGNYPFVRVKDAPGEACPKMSKILIGLRAKHEKNARSSAFSRASLSAQVSRTAIQAADENNFRNDNEIDIRFQRERKRIDALARRHVATGHWDKVNDSVIDYRVCKKLLDTYPAEQIKEALIRNSPAIEIRHSNMKNYADRTVTKAENEWIQAQGQSHSKNHCPTMGN